MCVLSGCRCCRCVLLWGQTGRVHTFEASYVKSTMTKVGVSMLGTAGSLGPNSFMLNYLAQVTWRTSRGVSRVPDCPAPGPSAAPALLGGKRPWPLALLWARQPALLRTAGMHTAEKSAGILGRAGCEAFSTVRHGEINACLPAKGPQVPQRQGTKAAWQGMQGHAMGVHGSALVMLLEPRVVTLGRISSYVAASPHAAHAAFGQTAR